MLPRTYRLVRKMSGNLPCKDFKPSVKNSHLVQELASETKALPNEQQSYEVSTDNDCLK